MKDSFIFYRSFFEAIDSIPDNAILYKAIAEYALNRVEIELTGIYKSIFILVKPQLDANWARFENGAKPKKNKKQNISKNEANRKQNISKNEANKSFATGDFVSNVFNENVFNENEISIDPRFKSCFDEWLSYKKNRKETYKTIASKKKLYNRLLELSKHNPQDAQKIVDQSIANNYAGLFPINDNKKKTYVEKEETLLCDQL